MKTIIKSLALVALFSTIAFTASAQLGAQTSTSATARILKQITLGVDSIQFGTIAAGGGQTFINPTNFAGSTNIGFNSRIGRLTIDATADEPIRVEFDSTVKMLGPGGTDSIVYRPILSAVHGNLAITNANTALSVLTSADAPSAGQVTATTNRTGDGPFVLVQTEAGSEDVTMFLGGYLYQWNTTNPVPSSQTTGTYRGTLNFNVVYNN
jgi:hypothetical protein